MSENLLRLMITGKSGGFYRKKAFTFLLIALLCLAGDGYANVIITAASGGTNICSSTAVGGSAPRFTTLGTITFTEGSNNDLAGPATDILVLSAPTGWQFSTDTAPIITYILGANITTVPVFTLTATTMTISITTSGTNAPDQFFISGLRVQATSTSSAAGNIYPSSATGIAGLIIGTSGTNFGSLSLMAPLVPSVTVTASPSGAVCPGTNVLFLSNPVNGGTAPTYQWYLNGSSIATGATYSNNALANGNTISCTMTANGSCMTTSSANSNTYIMTVLTGPLPVNGSFVTCPGTTITLSDNTPGGTWSSSNAAIAQTNGSGDVTGISVGAAIISYVSGDGCASVANITVNAPPYAPVLSPTLTTMCSGNVMALTATGTPYPTTILSQNFNSGIAPWTVDSSGSISTLPGSAWKDCGNGYINEEGIYFSADSSAFAMTNSDTSGASSYTSSKLISPVFSLVGYSGATLTFQQAYEYWPAGDSIVSVQISTDGGITWATIQNYVGADVGNRTNFVRETFSLNAYLGQSDLRLRFYYYCHWGYYWAIDNVVVSGVSSLVIPVWSPITDLYTNAACTSAYNIGTALNTVYMHPPAITMGGSITYTATAVSAGCVAASTSTINFNPSPSAIIGNLPLCAGATISLSDTTTGGTWSSGNMVIASVVPGTGMVAANVTGTATISYTLSTGCTSTVILTVNALPAIISGNEGVCIGATTSLSDDTTGGWWTSSNTSIATIGSGTGVVTSVSTGMTNITYTIGTGCNSVASITVNPLPPIIDGNMDVCVGLTTNLTDTNAGGVWTSGATAIATSGSGSGIITGVSAGSAAITYTLGTGCKTTTNVTVNPLQVITGVKTVCAGSTTTLTDGIAGGTWSSGNTLVATVSSGVVNGQAAGTVTIYYSLSTGCIATTIVTVNPLPNPISGLSGVCIGYNITLSDLSSGGVWSSGLAGIATIGSSSGVVHGVASGSTGIRYTLSTGCFVTQLVTVNSLPQAISGGMTICATSTTTLSDATGGGTWISGNPIIATIGSTGIVNGITAGTTSITYTLSSGCAANAVVTVNPLPLSINGNPQVCYGLTNILTDGTNSGVWSSSATSVATIGSGSGVLTGVNLGTAIITYALSTGCLITADVTINPLPGNINGPLMACAGSTTTLTDTSNGGIWTSETTTIAVAGSGTGVIGGVNGGTTIITYTLPSGCMSTAVVTVNPLPNAINGIAAVCVGFTTTLSNLTTGGTWSSSNTSVGNIGSPGIVTGVSTGTANITYTLNTGCFATVLVTVTALPQMISGNSTVCQQSNDSLNDITIGGLWSSGNTLNAAIGSSNGIVTGLLTGTTMISYTIPIAAGIGCSATKILTVNQTPGSINGITAICSGSMTHLTDNTTGGTWSSSNTTVFTIGSSSGNVSGITAGNSIVTYMLGDGCTVMENFTINVMPTVIHGITNVCAGLVTSLSDNVDGGVWTSGSTAIANVGSATGNVSGYDVGSTTITYGFPTGCMAFTTITVNLTPNSISGNTGVCLGFTTNLSDGTTGGVWTSDNTSLATVGSSSGLVATSLAGIATIYYTLPTGCNTAVSVTVNPQPSAISGTTDICAGTETILTNLINGGTWASSNITVATIGSSSGLLTGMGSGTATISYSLDAGCVATTMVTVHLLPSSIAGGNVVCAGSTTTLSDPIGGHGAWSSSAPAIATIGSATGTITGIASGTAIVTYSLGVGCTLTTMITVNPLPAVIIEPANLCFNSSIMLSDSTSGGTWSSSNTMIAGIGSLTGNISGVAAGTVNITYMLATGCYTETTLTVYPLPGIIGGTTTVCAGLTTTLNDSTPGGTWSSSQTSIASNGTAAGIVDGVSAGTANITYTLGTGCFVSEVLTVNPLPQPIGGSNMACAGLSSNLTDVTNGGVWSSGSTVIATINSSTGIVNGNVAGTCNITYALTTGCISTLIFTVEPLPATINGPVNVCQGLTINLTDGTGAGVWSTNSSSIASIGSLSGVLSGNSMGTAIVSYRLNTGCLTTKNVTVNQLPAAIYGTADVCIGSTTTLSDLATGGVWSSSNTMIGAIGSNSGIVLGLLSGTTNITYTTTEGCIAIYTVTVNPQPSVISGVKNVCAGATTYLSDSLAGGTWISGAPGIASIGSVSGIVNGILQGTAAITYISGYGCIAYSVVTVNPLPESISGLNNVCVASTISLTDDSPGGIWSSGSTLNATIGTSSGLVSGVLAGNAMITYTLNTGCLTWGNISINPLPSVITGNKEVCQGLTITLSDTLAGGTWISSSTAFAIIGSGSGIVSGIAPGTSTVTYTLPTGCSISSVVTVNPLPSGINGNTIFCVGLTTNLSDPTISGYWSSDAPGIGMIGSASGIVTGISAGTAMITYTIATGCISTTAVTVNTLASILGATFICSGTTTVLSDTGGTGIWTSTNSSVASIGSTSGSVTGSAPGTATISFILSAGCITSVVVTVNSLPSSISGPTNVCAGQSITLTDGSTGGSWSSNNLSVAAINALSGTLTGVTAGTTNITYTVGGTGCSEYTNITVNPLPAVISGIESVCKGSTTNLSDSSTGGVWTNSNTAVAVINPGSGIISGVAPGTTTVTYTLTTGCIATAITTVDPLPSAIMGAANVCAGFTTTLSDSLTGGRWSSTTSSGILAVDSVAGTVTGISAGTAMITYTLPTGCITNTIVTVNPLPPVIRGSAQVCTGLTTSLSDFSTGGTWVSNAVSVATIGSVTGIASGIEPGTTKITYTLPTGCATTILVTVNALPAPINGTDSVCAGLTITLTDATAGGVWSSAPISGIASVDSAAGVVTAASAGIVPITYSLGTGCITTTVITVNALPLPITGITNVCMGLSTNLTDVTLAGIWSTGTSGIAVVGSTGVVNSIGAGVTIITYTLGTGCIATTDLTVNPLPPAPIALGTGSENVCVGSGITLSDAFTGGTWSSATTVNATIGSGSGIVSGLVSGTAMITYKLSTGCISTSIITVNPLPAPISGVMDVCVGLSINLSDSIGTGTWSTGAVAIASVGSSGVVTGVSAGTTTVSYVLTTGCQRVALITVEPLPDAITGVTNVCSGFTTSLTDASSGGTWSIGSGSAALIGTASGIVSGISAGTGAITYTLSTGCINTTTVTVLSSPLAINGVANVCAGLTTTLSDIITGGTWSSSSTAIVVAGSSTGFITGVSAGVTHVSYTSANGCFTAEEYTVNALPSTISGNHSVCLGTISVLSDSITGGVWSINGTTGIAAIGSASGIVSGTSLGTAIITYTLPTECMINTEITVNPYPAAITGGALLCEGATLTLTDVTIGGIWSSGNTLVATTGSGTGVVTGTGGGDAIISYILPSGCYSVKQVSVNPISPISGNRNICEGYTNILSDATGGGTWNSNDTVVASINSSTGAIEARVSGTTIIYYALSTGCTTSAIVTVNSIPPSFNVIGGGSYCSGGSGLTIGLNGSDTGVYYELYNGASIIASMAGTGIAINYGLYTLPGTYTIIAINNNTSCFDTMMGVAHISVTPLVVPSVDITTISGDTVCAGTTTLFTAEAVNGGTAPAFSWYLDGASVGLTGNTYTYLPADGDIISVKMTSNAACATPDTAIGLFNVVTVPAVTPSLSITSIPGTNVCQNESVLVLPIPEFGGSAPSYRWIKNGVTAAVSDTFSYIPNNGDNIICVMNSDYKCLVTDSAYSTNNLSFIVHPQFVAAVTLSAHPGTTILAGQSDTVTAVVSNQGTLLLTYQWAVNGTLVPGATNDTFISSDFSNNDAVSCTVSSNAPCDVVTTTDVVINVNSTGVNNTGNPSGNILILPNPNNGDFMIKGSIGKPISGDIKLQITNMIGQLLLEKNIRVNNGYIDESIHLNSALAGAYLLQLSIISQSNVPNPITMHFILTD